MSGDPAAAGTALTYPFGAARPGDGVLQVAPGLFWVRMPLPFQLDHVNLWLLEDGDGWCAIDTGLGTPAIEERWQALLEGGLGGRPIRRVLVTHMHPDHIGLAGWLTRRTGAELLATRTEWLTARMLSLDTSAESAEESGRFYRRAGLAKEAAAPLRRRGDAYRRTVSPVPPRYRRIRHGDELAIGGRRWRVLVGRGHAPEHACLHCPELDVLIAGDQVLPRITPNIGVWPAEPLADPLADFLASLDALRPLPETILVLPSHGEPFTGLHARLDQLAGHHAERLDTTLAACREPATVAEVTRVLFQRPLDSHQLGFAVGETLSHLNHLVELGRLSRREDGSGVLRFQAR